MLSFVVPESDGMMTTDFGPSATCPVSTISAHRTLWQGRFEARRIRSVAGCIRMPAPPDPMKKRLSAPSATRRPTNVPRSRAMLTVPVWMRRKRAGSKFSMVFPFFNQ